MIVACNLQSVQPPREVDRTSILDGLYTEMLSILTAHSPGPRQHSHRRRQPAWWDADCLAACVARNGALRDMRFSAARQQFHRTVRPNRRNFWSLWQDHVSSLSAHNPRVAASIIRRTFQCNTDSRQVERVQWPDHPDSFLPKMNLGIHTQNQEFGKAKEALKTGPTSA